MPPALIVDAAFVTNPSSTITAMAAGGGSTLTVRNYALASNAWLVGLTRKGATAGVLRVRSPYLIDDVQGARYALSTGVQAHLLPKGLYQRLQTQDTIIVEATGGASESDGALLSTYYDDLPGSAMKLKSPGDIMGAYQYIFTWEVNTTASGTIGTFAGTALTNLYDVSRANTWYACLGFVVDTALLGVALNGPDTSNFNVGGPGDTTVYNMRSYFIDKSVETGKPCIPVFNTANKGATVVNTVDVAASTTSNVTLILAAMPPTWVA